eukprot:CAMPEP_0202690262 /NCGR_PEP_ID=MMETSP1385-20130828/5295_1 /ASSEMBLY_ACC=CAM_ASM_000861 /TAXON_ID=933848 /ORGANISM="Elphidium margaritaceum" /LENGTH=798 /DNA_ID=CAMNT_0049345499 /DNA_START=35 /DNA_END=2431 /DNA_ORIENTATION=+
MAEQKSNVYVFEEEEFDLALKGPKISDAEVSVFRDIAFRIRHPDQKREVPWPADCQPRREVFGSDLAFQYTYEWQTGNQYNCAYEVEVNAFIGLQYNVSFEGTDNCDIQTAFSKSGNTLSVALQPYERETVFLLSCGTKEDNKYDIKGTWKKSKIDTQLYREAIVIANNKIVDEYNKCLKGGLNETVAWDKMPAVIRSQNLLFVDGEFYPNNEALYFKGDADPNAIGDQNNDNYIQWRRAGDFIAGGFPRIFKNPGNLSQSVRPEYIRMGGADDAWLIAVLSTCALKPSIIANLFLSSDGNNDASNNREDKMYGFYRMRLCVNGIWKDCIVDDLFPCRPYWLPVMASAPDNDQLWPHLCEKLVAKIRGNCYEALNGGSPSAAFADITGCPTEEYDLRTYDTDLLFEKLHTSYNVNNYNMLAVAVCNAQHELDNVEQRIGLISGHTYSVLGIDLGAEKIQLRDPFGRNENKFGGQYATQVSKSQQTGVMWLSFAEFVEYFTNVVVCYSENAYKEARQTIDLSFDSDKQQVSVPILKLTVPNGGNVEYLGLAQKDLSVRSQNPNRSHLDLCLFVFKANDAQASLDVAKHEPHGYIPMSTQRNKFVRFGASDEEVKSNDVASGFTWKTGDRLTPGTYFLVPWSSGVQWQAEHRLQGGNATGDVRYIGLSVHGKVSGNGEFTIQPVDGLTGDEVTPILMRVAFKYGEKKQWQDLERRYLQLGQLDIYCGRNTCQDKNLLFSMTPSVFSNITNAAGFQPFAINREVKYKLLVGQQQLFAVNVPNDPSKEFSCTFKFGLENEWL